MLLANKLKESILKKPQIDLEKSFNAKDPLKFVKNFKSFLRTLPVLHSLVKKEKLITKITNVKNKIKKRVNIENNIKEKYKKIANISKKSYANRFLIKKNRKLYKKTICIPFKESLSTTQEFDFFLKKNKAILKEQRRHSFRERFQNYSRNKLLSNRAPKAAKIYITHVRKNSFVTIHDIFGENYDLDKKVAVKFSCGSIGYRNKKKTTDYARDQTVKNAGNHLTYSRYTSIDIIYTSNTSYRNKKALRGLIPNPMYVRLITINNNRPHSFVRKRKCLRK